MGAALQERIILSARDDASAALRSLTGSFERLTDRSKQTEDRLRRTEQTSQKLSSTFRDLRGIIATIGVGVLAKNTLELADNFTSLQQRIQLSTSSISEYAKVQTELIAISQRTSSSLESNISLFQRVSNASKALGATSTEVLALNEVVANLGKISGSTNEQFKNASTQFSQLLSGPRVQAEEFNSILDGMPALIFQVEQSLGYLPGTLKQAIKDGEVLSKDVFRALLDDADLINQKASGLPVRLDQASENIRTGLLVSIGRINEEFRITERLAKRLDDFAKNNNAIEQSFEVALLAAQALSIYISTRLVASLALAARQVAITGGSLALLGGPVGAFALAATAAAVFAFELKKTNDQVQATRLGIDGVARSLQGLSFDEAFTKTNELYTALILKEQELERLQAVRAQPGRSGRANKIREVSRAEADVNAIKAEIDRAEQQLSRIEQLEDRFKQNQSISKISQETGAKSFESKKEFNPLAEEYKAFVDNQTRIEEAERESIRRRIEFRESIEAEHLARKAQTIQEEKRLELEGATFTRDTLAFLQDFEQKSQGQRVLFAKQTGAGILAQTALYSKKAFEVNKAFQIGQAVIEGYGAIQKAYNSAPAPYSFVLAGLMAAKTALQIRGIKAASFGGGSTPQAGGGGSGAIPNSAIPDSSTITQAEPQRQTTIAIQLANVGDDTLLTGKALRKITEDIADQLNSNITVARFS